MPSATSTQQLADDLRAMLALLDSPEKWTQGALARDRNGDAVEWFSGDASCFCIFGAIAVVCPGYDRSRGLMRAIERTLTVASVPDWQDAPDRTYADVIAAVQATLANAEAAHA